MLLKRPLILNLFVHPEGGLHSRTLLICPPHSCKKKLYKIQFNSIQKLYLKMVTQD